MYGVCITLGILISLVISERYVKKNKLDPEIMYGGFLTALVFGIIGARLYHVFDYWWIYSQNIDEIIKIWHGGLGIFGAILGGMVGIIFYLKHKNESIAKWLDIGGMVMPLGQAFGRWGNYFNRELLPYALYESVADVILFLLLQVISQKKQKKDGVVFFSYLAGYSAIRIVLERFHPDNWYLHGVSVSKAISVFLIVISVYFLSVVIRKKAVKK